MRWAVAARQGQCSDVFFFATKKEAEAEFSLEYEDEDVYLLKVVEKRENG